MKKVLGIIAVALFVILVSVSCKTRAHCDAYSGMSDQTEKTAR